MQWGLVLPNVSRPGTGRSNASFPSRVRALFLYQRSYISSGFLNRMDPWWDWAVWSTMRRWKLPNDHLSIVNHTIFFTTMTLLNTYIFVSILSSTFICTSLHGKSIHQISMKKCCLDYNGNYIQYMEHLRDASGSATAVCHLCAHVGLRGGNGRVTNWCKWHSPISFLFFHKTWGCF